MAIKTWACKQTQAIFDGGSSDIVPRNLIRRANIKLLMLDAAVEIRDLTIPPANCLEKLHGNRKGTAQHPNQQPVPGVFRVAQQRRLPGRNRGLSLRIRIMAKRAPIHPGEVLRTEFLHELDLSAYALAKALSVPANRITGIVNGQRAITADTALRLARFFGTTAEFWLNLQMRYDLQVAATRTRHIEREVTSFAAMS